MQQPEPQFDDLRRALKLKRHEQPPPGYFRSLSSQVITRLRENDVHDRARALDAASWEAPWLTRMLDFFQGRPIYSGALGAAACLLLLGGIFYTSAPGPAPATADMQGLGTPQNLTGVGLAVTGDGSAGANQLGALPPGTTLFDKARPLQSAPVFSSTNLLKK